MWEMGQSPAHSANLWQQLRDPRGTFPPWKKGEKGEKSSPVQREHHILPQRRRDSRELAEP